MSDRSARLQALQQALKERILILDGGMGTMIQSYKLEEADYRGERFADWPSDVKGNNDLLLLTQPKVIAEIEKAYLDAGADILETNTFNATQVSQADYGMESLVYELNVAGARVAREVCDAKTLEIAGVVENPFDVFAECSEIYLILAEISLVTSSFSSMKSRFRKQ